MQETLFGKPKERILTVSELTRELKNLLEEKFSSVWLMGEISNFHAHSSGHFYFTLKDAGSQIGAVMFRGANRQLKFRPEDGMEVVANGRLSIYEVRGNYQIIIDYLEPKGLGALQLAFEQLRKKLEAEGLFEPARKRPLPFLPRTVGIVTSPSGAVLHDLIHVIRRRAPQTNILLVPVNVQGEAAAPEIAAAIEAMNEQGDAEILIVGRGGGSLEDLWAFNTEIIARAIYASKIPVVSAVGHETDVTISDFVADLRAPTPSAAAELVVPVARELLASLKETERKMLRILRQGLTIRHQHLKFWLSHLKHPKKRLEEWSQHLDDLISRSAQAMEFSLKDRKNLLAGLSGKLQVLSPLSTLSRGYSIVRKALPNGEEGAVVKEASQVSRGDLIGIALMKGHLQAEIKEKS
jgi:exodeoxyribonuclease VII large subunit